ncbi:MAG: hypothetical protein EDR02_11290 [Actinobacteria bacterium]|nr:MAG: hypothetical protein EDR02_11290 [Actinomycetota bacterium]
MPVDEARRHALYTKLEQVLGADQAERFMQLTPPTEWTQLATHDDLANLETRLGARIDGLEAHVENMRVGLEARIENVQVGLESRIENVRVGLEARMDGLETDLRASEARLIDELHRLLRLQTIWFIGAIFTLAALILTAAKFV